MMALSLTTYGALGLTFTAVYLAYRTFISSKVHYPPGPRPYPIIGNPFDIPPTFQEVAFAKLAEKYGAVSLLDTL
jgi:coumaroylquinate(coumaroylshikimate) 3'-monooxygenase